MSKENGAEVLNTTTEGATTETGATPGMVENNNSSNSGYPPPRPRSGSPRNWAPPRRYMEAPAENAYNAGEEYLLTGRVTSTNPSEGLTVPASQFMRTFGYDISALPNYSQVSVLSKNGDWFYGYALNTQKSRVYFPRPHLPEGFPVPTLKMEQDIPAVTLVIG